MLKYFDVSQLKKYTTVVKMYTLFIESKTMTRQPSETYVYFTSSLLVIAITG